MLSGNGRLKWKDASVLRFTCCIGLHVGTETKRRTDVYVQMLRTIAHSVLLSKTEFLGNIGRKTISMICFQSMKLTFTRSFSIILIYTKANLKLQYL